MGDTAELMRFFQYRVEHRREITGRGIDDPEHLGRRRLLLLRLVTLSFAFSKLTS